MTGTIQEFDYSVDLMKSLLWQYQGAVRLQELIEEKQDWYDINQTAFWTDWQRDVFDLQTANYFGLSVWAIILGQPIIFPNVANPNKENWGFGSFHVNFNRGNFASTTGFTYVLSPETARILLKLRYFQLVSSGTVPETNRMLKFVFADYGDAYLIDGHDMTQLYIFTFALPSDLKFLFDNYDVLPRPAGVGSSYRVVVEESWGFGEFHENFDHGNFSEE